MLISWFTYIVLFPFLIDSTFTPSNWSLNQAYGCFVWYLSIKWPTVVECPHLSCCCADHLIKLSWRSYIDGLMQERRNSIANALELRLSCIKPSISYSMQYYCIIVWRLYSDVDCKRTPNGIEYLGNTDTTAVGEPCRSWAESPSVSFPFGTQDSHVNYCRTATLLDQPNLDFMDKPWCYNISGRPSPCNITFCGKEKFLCDTEDNIRTIS